VEQAWDILTPVMKGWAASPPPQFPNYEAGTWGPAEAARILTDPTARWHLP